MNTCYMIGIQPVWGGDLLIWRWRCWFFYIIMCISVFGGGIFLLLSVLSYPVINVTWLLQVHLPSALADGLIKYLSLWTLVPFLKTLYLGEMWLKPKKESACKPSAKADGK